MPGVAVPTEAVELPAAFLRLGVAGVMATLWPVGDDAARLAVPFAVEGWLTGRPLADALAEAQRWLRNLLAEEAEELLGHALAAERPFSGIRSWASFTLTGA